MSPAQRLLAKVLPARWFADLEAETRVWQVTCTVCGLSKDLWDAGGIRWRAKGTSVTKGHCSACDARQAMEISIKTKES